jgi:hypothetical protein
MNKIGVCEYCDNRIEVEIYNVNTQEYDDVCSECFDKQYRRTIEQGEKVFTEFCEEMLGRVEGMKLVRRYFPKEQDNTEVYLFAYGILKYPKNLFDDGAIEVIENCRTHGHVMYLYNNSFPITRQTGKKDNVIFGTVAKVPMWLLTEHYDHIEGYDPNRPHHQNMYNRKLIEVHTPNGEVIKSNMYIANPSMFAKDFKPNKHIITGNFDDSWRVKTYKRK